MHKAAGADTITVDAEVEQHAGAQTQGRGASPPERRLRSERVRRGGPVVVHGVGWRRRTSQRDVLAGLGGGARGLLLRGHGGADAR